MMLQAGFTLVTLKLLFLLALFVITGPVVTHALAQACLHEGVQPKLTEDRRGRDRAGRRRAGRREADIEAFLNMALLTLLAVGDGRHHPPAQPVRRRRPVGHLQLPDGDACWSCSMRSTWR